MIPRDRGFTSMCKRGALVARYERSGRINRWLYQGLHHLDFPFLWQFRPAWDFVVIVLLAGGIVLSCTGIWIGYRRVQIATTRLTARIRSRESKSFPSSFRPAG